MRFPAWSIRVVLMDWITRRGIYKGVRAPEDQLEMPTPPRVVEP